MKKEPMVHISVVLEADQHARLQALSEYTRVPFAVYLREGLDMVLNRSLLPSEEDINAEAT